MRRLLAIAIVAIAAVAVAHETVQFGHGLSLVLRAADLHGSLRALADLDTVRIREASLDIPVPGGPMRARLYTPVGRARYAALVIPGLQPAGISDVRLVQLSRALARSNVTVVTPEILELTRFEVTARAVDRIEEAAVWLATASGLEPSGRIGLLGISVTGGLALVAAGRPSLRRHLRYVFSFGGHDEIRNIFMHRWDAAEPGVVPEPDSYTLAIALLNVAPQFVPGDQRAFLDSDLRHFLWASYLERSDAAASARELAALRSDASRAPEPAATLLRDVVDGDTAALESRLEPYIDVLASDPRLSPARSPVPTAPVYLLHGRNDAVIPADESRHTAARLRGQVAVHLLITNLVSHAAADQPPRLGDITALARFWGDLLAE